ncbi:MAG: hypothetical protein K0R34_142 [Herbinix sp.]|jgi:hypothetical protein|nr:hypothetical protein [Herbinix sp.]
MLTIIDKIKRQGELDYMKSRRMLVVIIAIMLFITNLLGVGNTITAKAEGATAITISEIMGKDDLIVEPGTVKHIKIPIRAVGGYISNVSLQVEAGKDVPFTVIDAKLSKPNDYTPIVGIAETSTTYVEFNVDVKETGSIGYYPVTIKTNGTNAFGDSINLSLSVNIQIVKEKASAQLSISEISILDPLVGSDTNIVFRVKNEGEISAMNTYVSINYGTSNIAARYDTPKMKLGDLGAGRQQYMTFPIRILSSATEGMKTVTVTFDYKDVDGKPVTETRDLYINVRKNDRAPSLIVEGVSYDGNLKPGQKVTVIASIYNDGKSKAQDISIKVDDASLGTDGFVKGYYTDSVYVGSVKPGATIKAKIPLVISKQAAGGLKKLGITMSYTDSVGNPYTSAVALYPEILGGSGSSDASLILTNVKQSPEQPIAGDNMAVSFDLKNASRADITEIKISLPGLDGSTFIPTNSEPYILVDKIEAGKSKKVSIPLKVSDAIPEGLSNLSVKYSYAGSAAIDPVVIPIRNVQNDLGSNSKPKLIISKYVADAEELRAGSTFNFTFDIYNTHSSISAKNITVTLTQADNVFSVTQGSNSFFISKIEPGESVQQSVELKVKSDASTKAYPLKLAIEYEYEGIEPNPETGEVGEKRNEELNLQAVENSRPVVDYVNVYSWDGNVVMGNPATLSFEFYNMGRSPLNNVIATVEGDFTKADGNMYFIGNVAEGSSAFAEFDVIPNIEGTANGVLRVTFEDSNGDKIEFTKEFQTEIMPAAVIDPGMVDGGAGEVFNPEMPVAKKAILPVWLFVILQLVIVAVFVPVTRKVLISAYKAKLRKKEQEEI